MKSQKKYSKKIRSRLAVIVSFLIIFYIGYLDLTDPESPIFLIITVLMFFIVGAYTYYYRDEMRRYRVKLVTAVSSPDKVVQGKIMHHEYTPKPKNQRHRRNLIPDHYICEVTRTYNDGKYAKQEKFETLYKAEIWLDRVFDDEFAKHLERNTELGDKIK